MQVEEHLLLTTCTPGRAPQAHRNSCAPDLMVVVFPPFLNIATTPLQPFDHQDHAPTCGLVPDASRGSAERAVPHRCQVPKTDGDRSPETQTRQTWQRFTSCLAVLKAAAAGRCRMLGSRALLGGSGWHRPDRPDANRWSARRGPRPHNASSLRRPGRAGGPRTVASQAATGPAPSGPAPVRRRRLDALVVTPIA